jgi:hypothetical protein
MLVRLATQVATALQEAVAVVLLLLRLVVLVA